MNAPPTTRLAAANLIQRAWLQMDFFGRSSDSGESDTGSALTSTIFSQSFFAFLLAALLFDSDVRPAPYVAANLSLSTLLVGIGALADPQRAIRRRRADLALLLPAPLPRGTIALARAMHGTFYTALITLGMAIPPAILCHWVFDGSFVIIPLYLLAACLMSALCAGTIGIGLRIVERVLSASASLLTAGTIRALFLGGGLVGFALCLRRLDTSAAEIPFGPVSAWAWPPFWIAKIFAYGAEASDAALALVALIVTICVLGLVLPESGAQRARNSGRHPNRRGFLAAGTARVERALTESYAPLRGATRFVATMLYRSASFRARVLPLLGVPIAMTGLSFVDADPRGQRLLLGMTLQFPAIYLPFLIAFLPHAERAGSGHVFDTAPLGTRGGGVLRLAREASLIALTTRILTPILLITFVLGLLAGEHLGALLPTAAFSWGCAVWIATVQLRSLPTMPFTLDESDDAAADFGNLMGTAMVLAVIGGAYALFVDNLPIMLLGFVIAASAAWRLSQTSQHARNATAA